LLTKTLIYALLALALMVADRNWALVPPLRTALSAALAPVQAVGRSPVLLAQDLGRYFVDLHQAQTQADTAHQALVGMSLQQAELGRLRAENASLRQLLGLRQYQLPQGVGAQIMYAAADAYSRKVIADKGSADGIVLGSPVLDAQGVVGQVSRVYLHSAEVSLLIGQGYTIPVRNQRTGATSVAYGLPAVGGGRLELKYLPSTADVQTGDMLTTSGMDGIYPANVKVATVESVDRRTDSTFARVYCKPVGQVDATYVLITPPVGLPGVEAQAVSALQAPEAKAEGAASASSSSQSNKTKRGAKSTKSGKNGRAQP